MPRPAERLYWNNNQIEGSGGCLMNRPLNELLLTVQVLAPQHEAGLQAFGLRWPSESQLGYRTLDELMASDALEVTEINEGGSVPTLRVTNKSDLMAFLMAGEQLVGAKQNRVLNVSLMVPPAVTLDIPVSCVEAGRWNRRSAKFASGGYMSHGKLRKMMSKQMYLRLRTSRSPTSDQGAVWEEVSRKLLVMGSASPSEAFDQVYQDYAARLNDLGARLQPPEGCHGVLFAVAGQIEGADLFDQPATLVKLWPKLVQAYALDAMELGESKAPPITTEDGLRWLQAAAGAKTESYPSPGIGRDIRLEATAMSGSALVVGEQAVHLELFAESPAPQP
jgi:hypothetical protein